MARSLHWPNRNCILSLGPIYLESLVGDATDV